MLTKILIIGGSGMLGNALLRFFSRKKNFDVSTTIRSSKLLGISNKSYNYQLFNNIHLEDKKDISKVFDQVRPDVVINCAGVIKHSNESIDHLKVLLLNTILPHYLAKLSENFNARLIHFSTDCVFLGSKGNYNESDFPDALDFYGRSKLLGEINYPNTITIRTSLVGHELNSTKNLIEWFLMQNHEIKGYNEAIFSGLSTFEVAKVIDTYILPNKKLEGLYHLSSQPISKYGLLLLVKKIYKKSIGIIKDHSLKINRSLDSSRFCKATNYVSKPWDLMIQEMKEFK
jgi:dTDP-4-dehydrorhamnose reductase